MTMTKGQCNPCKTQYAWESGKGKHLLLLRDACCVKCGRKLSHTSAMTHGLLFSKEKPTRAIKVEE